MEPNKKDLQFFDSIPSDFDKGFDEIDSSLNQVTTK